MIAFVAIAASSCKLDAPVYPIAEKPPEVVKPDTTTIPDAGPDSFYTVPIGALNTIVFKIDDGENVTLTEPTADITPNNGSATTGYTMVLADQVSPEVTFKLNFSAARAGEFADDLLWLIYKDFRLTDDSSGKVKAVIVRKDTNGYLVKGYFRILATNDNDGTLHTVIGSFNVSK
ncbi:hypothetical protein DYU05_09575 [Mucilaginibacter terrenus]|uniref:Uncharacterized protein n=2 Tax=Mucilaginibacter terrenus TaxID=2482727 RepID=A0A3E2NY27_9SPHI|nr:hypothetical protein DYU05_09575 [Mucilaginibacter terrenus]